MCLAIPGLVTSISERDGLPFASVRFGGIERQVCLACQPDAVPGDFVLVHVGMAIARIDREQAEQAYATLTALGQLEDQVDDEPPPLAGES
jgi:hydrogenase expression/formation protein HypC